jgi:hypothetical protein
MNKVRRMLERERVSSRFITLTVVVSMICSLLIFVPRQTIYANDFDVVIETTIEEESYKVLELKNTTGTVHFYEFSENGDPVVDSNNEQTTFTPGDVDFEDRISYMGGILSTKHLTITSNVSFDLHLYVYDTSNSKLIREIEYDEDNPTDYYISDHACYGLPFNSTSVIGEFIYVNYNQSNYFGYYYVPDTPMWIQSPISGQLSDVSKQASMDTGNVKKPTATIEGTTSSGRKVKIVYDTENGVRIYEDKNGDGEFSDDEEITDNEEKEEIFNEVANDIKNGNGSYDVNAVDEDGNPIDIIIWFKNSDGTYTGINIDYNSSTGEFDLSAKTNCSSSCLRYCGGGYGYFPSQDDHEPTYAWFVGYKTDDAPCYGFARYARFNENGELDESGEQKPYRHDGSNYDIKVCTFHEEDINGDGIIEPGEGRYLIGLWVMCSPWPDCC